MGAIILLRSLGETEDPGLALDYVLARSFGLMLPFLSMASICTGLRSM